MKVGVLLAIVAFVTYTLSNAYILKRNKRAYEDHFNVLLNLYKINPLKQSNIFKAFSNRILLQNPDGAPDWNPNLNESEERKSNATPNTGKGIETTDTNPTQNIEMIYRNIPEFNNENYVDKYDPNYRIHITTETIRSNDHYANVISNVNDDKVANDNKIGENIRDKAKYVDAEVVIL